MLSVNLSEKINRPALLELQQQGIEIAKRTERYKGLKPLFKEPKERLKHAFGLYLSGKSYKDVPRLTGINRETSRRYRKKFGVERSNSSTPSFTDSKFSMARILFFSFLIV